MHLWVFSTFTILSHKCLVLSTSFKKENDVEEECCLLLMYTMMTIANTGMTSTPQAALNKPNEKLEDPKIHILCIVSEKTEPL